MSRIHTFSREPSTPEFWPRWKCICNQPCLAKGTKIGPSFEVQVVMILGTHGLEGAVPSKRDHLTPSWVLTSKGKNRVVDEVRTPNVSYIVPNDHARKKQNLVMLPILDPGNWRGTPLASGDWLRTLSLLLRNQCVSRKEPLPRWKGSGESFPLGLRLQEEHNIFDSHLKNGNKTGTSFRSR